MVLGQFSFIATIATLVITARLRKFDIALEEAALNLGAIAGWRSDRDAALPRAGADRRRHRRFLMTFENFNTTLMLVGSDAPLTITMSTG